MVGNHLKEILSQNQQSNNIIFNDLSQNITNNNNLHNLFLVDQKLSYQSWATLGQSIGRNKSLITVQINACNLKENDNI